MPVALALASPETRLLAYTRANSPAKITALLPTLAVVRKSMLAVAMAVATLASPPVLDSVSSVT